MTASWLVVLLALGLGVPHAYGVWRPDDLAARLRAFPRSNAWGYVLMLTATAWFLVNVRNEEIAEFAVYKPLMMAGFGAVGVGACFYLRDFLAVRGGAILLLLLAKFTLDTLRFHPSPWRILVAAWAYAWVFGGMWLTVSPWRARDLIEWATAKPVRLRGIGAAGTAFAVFLLVLGFTAFRQTG